MAAKPQTRCRKGKLCSIQCTPDTRQRFNTYADTHNIPRGRFASMLVAGWSNLPLPKRREIIRIVTLKELL